MNIILLTKRVNKMKAEATLHFNGGPNDLVELANQRKWAFRRVAPILTPGQRTLEGLGNSIMAAVSAEFLLRSPSVLSDFFRDNFGSFPPSKNYRMSEYLYFDHPDGRAHVEIQILDDDSDILNQVLIGERNYTDIDQEKLGRDLRILSLRLEKSDDTWQVVDIVSGGAYDYTSGCFVKRESIDPTILLKPLVNGSLYCGLESMRPALIAAGKYSGEENTGYKIYKQIEQEWAGEPSADWSIQFDADGTIGLYAHVQRRMVWVGSITVDRPEDNQNPVTIRGFVWADLSPKTVRRATGPSDSVQPQYSLPKANPADPTVTGFLGSIGSFAMGLSSFDQAKYFFDELFNHGNIWLYNSLKNAFEPQLGPKSPRNLSYILDVQGNWQEHLGPIDASVELTAFLGGSGTIAFEITGNVQL